MPTESGFLSDPICFGLSEIEGAHDLRSRVNVLIQNNKIDEIELSPSEKHVRLGLALTAGSALGQSPPTDEEYLAAYIASNKAGLTSGARAWSKHAHRSTYALSDSSLSIRLPSSDLTKKKVFKKEENAGWWGTPRGSVGTINEQALLLFDRIMSGPTWRNLHWLPHEVLVYEVRTAEGYGMRWSKQYDVAEADNAEVKQREEEPWVFRGFVEPMMDNGHELGWRH